MTQFPENRKPLIFAGSISLLCMALLFAWPVSGVNDLLISGSFLVIVFYSAFSLFKDPLPYSINKMFWIFNFVFMGVVPLFQYKQGMMAWSSFFPEAVFLHANAMILACFIVYSAIRTLLLKKPSKHLPTANPAAITPKAFRAGFIVFLLCCVGIIITYGGLKNIWFRPTADEYIYLNVHPTLALFLDKTLRGVTMYFSLLSVWLFRKKQITLPWLLTVLFCCVFVNFPLSLARYYAACLYISLLLSFHLKWLEKRNVFSISLIVGLLIVFPVLSLYRWRGDEPMASVNRESIYYFAFHQAGDYDAYTSICKTYQYIATHGITWGKQLLTVLLFFVPRSVWPGKSIGSGAMMHDPTLQSFHNFTCTFYAEGLINFGDIGALFFIAVFAIGASRYDRWYLRMRSATGLYFGNIFYPVAMILLFFMLRGDLLSSFAYLAGFSASAWLLHLFLLRVSKSG